MRSGSGIKRGKHKMLVIKDNHNHDLKYDVNRFPDGQQQFKMLESDARRVCRILTSIPTPSDLDLFLQAFHRLKQYHPEEVKINYFYGARSDKDIAGEYAVTNTAMYVKLLLEGLSDVTTKVLPALD